MPHDTQRLQLTVPCPPTDEQLLAVFTEGPRPSLRHLHIAQALLNGQRTEEIAQQHPGLSGSAVLITTRATLSVLARHALPAPLRTPYTRLRAAALRKAPYNTFWLPVLRRLIAAVEHTQAAV